MSVTQLPNVKRVESNFVSKNVLLNVPNSTVIVSTDDRQKYFQLQSHSVIDLNMQLPQITQVESQRAKTKKSPRV
jgi:hypothetical protein